MAKVQVGLLGSARALQRDLERIAKRADTNSSDGLAYVLQGANRVRTTPRKFAWRPHVDRLIFIDSSYTEGKYLRNCGHRMFHKPPLRPGPAQALRCSCTLLLMIVVSWCRDGARAHAQPRVLHLRRRQGGQRGRPGCWRGSLQPGACAVAYTAQSFELSCTDILNVFETTLDARQCCRSMLMTMAASLTSAAHRDQVSMAERRKFEEETLVNVSGRTRNRGATGRWAAQPGQNELIVVTILVAAQVGICRALGSDPPVHPRQFH